LDDFMLGNFRLHWIPKPGSDLFVVYNRGYTKLDSFKFADPSSSTGAAKIVWRFVF
jgi:cytochrome c2